MPAIFAIFKESLFVKIWYGLVYYVKIQFLQERFKNGSKVKVSNKLRSETKWIMRYWTREITQLIKQTEFLFFSYLLFLWWNYFTCIQSSSDCKAGMFNYPLTRNWSSNNWSSILLAPILNHYLLYILGFNYNSP